MSQTALDELEGSVLRFDGDPDYHFGNDSIGLSFWYSGAVDFSLP
jgi:hypothetical protein